MEWFKIKDIDIKISDGNYSSKYPRSTDFIDKGVPFIRANNLKNNSVVDEDMYFISPSQHADLKKGHLKQGDVLIVTRGNIGQVGLVPKEHENSNINAQLVLLRANNKIIHNKYLLYCFKNRKVLNQVLRFQTGTALKQLPVKKLKEIQIPLPPLQTQRKIVEVLDKAQSLIDIRKQQIELLDSLIQSTFYDMFGDPVKNDMGWDIRKLGDILKIDTNMTTDFIKYESLPHVGINNIEKNTGRLINLNTVKDDKLISGKYLFNKEHIIYSKIRPNLNKVALPLFNGLCSADAYPLLIYKDLCNRIFVAQILRSEYFVNEILRHSTRTNIPKVNKRQLLSFSTVVPPIELQNQFAQKVEKIEQQKALLNQSLKLMEDNFNSLMQRAFRGEIV